jgi:ribosomal protein RSM22 (predicted rRNA methylase)
MKVHLVDNTKVLLQLAQSLMQSRRPFTHHCDIAEFRLPKIEKDEIIVLILSYTYNELHQNPRALNFIDRLCAKIREQESLIVFMDPANQLQAFQAMELRDSLAQKGWQILYPCPADTACPMLANKRDWCFSESEWRRPRVVVEVDRMLELNRSRFAYAGYIFSSIPRPDVSRPTRLVGLPRVGKDEQCRLVCKGTRIERKPMPRGVNPQSLLRCQPASEQS